MNDPFFYLLPRGCFIVNVFFFRACAGYHPAFPFFGQGGACLYDFKIAWLGNITIVILLVTCI
ncbi:MAG: hypothetical protein ABI813_09420 [Bacteroidota bacterium]